MIAFRPTATVALLAILIVAALLAPSIIAIPASLTDRPYLSFPEHGPSLQHYWRFVSEPGWRDAFLLSLGTAALATCLAVPLGTAFAIGAWTLTARSATVVRALALLPIIVPGVVSAIAIYRQWTAFGLYDTVAGVVLVQMLVGMPFVVITVTAALGDFDIRLVQASRSLGAGALRTVASIVVPGVRAGILSGGALAFVAGWDESVISLFVTGRRVQVLPRMMWDGLRYDIDPIVAVVATVMLAVTAAGVAVALSVQRWRAASRPAGG